ncbi:Cys-Gln thioester bond-forming surface protein [Kitasatospora sp. NPDC052896]|uniref:Cys-Gln thioester bond-forming surface protein n=1 Tax=Kitasatospora sp. NPDC052896 TaxID=3364061 RepID=UPI0037CB0BEA
MLASSMLVGGGFTLAGAAFADGGNGGGSGSGATATLMPNLLVGGPVTINGDDRPLDGGLIGLKMADGTVLKTYCIDLGTETQDDAKYQENPWSATSLANNPDKGKINWILQNSFPQDDKLSDLAAKAGVSNLNERQAAEGTQAAIWHFSDHVDAVPVDGAAQKLTTYLINNAADVQEPSPSLTLTPSSVSGKSGALLGPITVSTTGSSVSASLDAKSAAAGVVLTDKSGTVLTDQSGKLLTGATNNEQLYVKAPAGADAGQATITANASAAVQVGRAFMGYSPNGTRSQTLILAGTTTDTVSATAGASWAPSGPIPAISAAVVCSQNAVVVTATNNGDQNYTFTLSGTGGGKSVTVKPGQTQSIPVPVAQGQSYDIKVAGVNGQNQEFKGILDCHVAGTTGGGTGASASPSTSASAPGTTPSTSASPTPAGAGGTGGTLAFTGGGSSAPLLAGIAGVLVVAGGGAVFAMRRRGRHSRTAA